MKKRILFLISILLASIFNVLFRYENMLNDLNNFNSNSSVIGGYIISSNADVPYLKIFIFSFILTILFFTLVIVILKKICNISFSEVIDRFNILVYLLFILISILFLFLNTFFSFVILIIGYILLIYSIYKEFKCDKYIYLICLLLILYLLVFYFISF